MAQVDQNAAMIASPHAVVTAAVARLFAEGVVLCDGAMGSMLYGHGIFMNRCYEELNVSQPDLIRAVHTQYLQAGAVVIETNTFGANALRLERYWLERRVWELNVAGVRVARQCVTQMRDRDGSEAFVAGAIGPLGVKLGRDSKVSDGEAYAAFAQQVRALAEGGPGVGADLLAIETMTSMAEAELAIRAAKKESGGLPAIAMVTVDNHGNCLDGTTAADAARLMTKWGADAVGCNCSEGPATVLAAIERMRKATRLPLAAMPNAGTPASVDGRSIYLTSPESMASYAKKFVEAGVRFVGGCCGTTPEYTRSMRVALLELEAQALLAPCAEAV